MAITFVNSTGLTIGTADSTWSIPTHSSVLGGAAFIVGIGLGSSAVTVSTITDNAGNVYRLAVRHPSDKPANTGAELWYATAVSSNSTRISITLSATSSGAIGVGQFDGISTANALTVTGSSAITANSTTHSVVEITPTTDNQLVVSLHRLNASTVGTATNLGGMTTWLSTTAVARTHGMYIIQGAASTCTGTFTTSSRCMHVGVIAAFSDTTAVAPYPGAPTLAMLGVG